MAEVINTEKVNLNKTKTVDQKLKQVAFLRIPEDTSKIVEYNREKGIIFLLNKAKPDKHLQLCTVKLKSAGFVNSDSDEGGKGDDEYSGKLKFEFVTECRLKLNNMIV